MGVACVFFFVSIENGRGLIFYFLRVWNCRFIIMETIVMKLKIGAGSGNFQLMIERRKIKN